MWRDFWPRFRAPCFVLCVNFVFVCEGSATFSPHVIDRMLKPVGSHPRPWSTTIFFRRRVGLAWSGRAFTNKFGTADGF